MTEIDTGMDLFIPHPGSRTDAVGTAMRHEDPGDHLPLNRGREMPDFAVATRQDMPEECVPRTLQLSANNPYLPILPRDMRRRRAVIIPVTNDVVLTETKEGAQAVAALVAGGGTASTYGNGAYVPKGTVYVIESRDWMFAAITTTSTSSPVSVTVERYAAAIPQ
jgi:hypothetical protein